SVVRPGGSTEHSERLAIAERKYLVKPAAKLSANGGCGSRVERKRELRRAGGRGLAIAWRRESLCLQRCIGCDREGSPARYAITAFETAAKTLRVEARIELIGTGDRYREIRRYPVIGKCQRAREVSWPELLGAVDSGQKGVATSPAQSGRKTP